MSFYQFVSANLGSGNRRAGGECGDRLHSKGKNNKFFNWLV